MEGPSTTSGSGEIRGTKRSADLADDSIQTRPTNSKKRLSLADYTYDVLFLQGERSDITIHAQEREWHLHKNLLCRSEYFAAMFSGAWEEADKSYIEMAVPENITPEALHTAFGSLYKDEVEVSSENVVDVLKAASFLQIDALIDTCTCFMKKSLTLSTVATYYSAAANLALHKLTEECLAYLDFRLLNILLESEQCRQYSQTFFQNASIELMEKLLSRKQLLMPLNEANLFLILIEFVTVKLQPAAADPKLNLDLLGTSDTPFLSCKGKPYKHLFGLLKLKQLVKLTSCADGMKRKLLEAVFPAEDLHRAAYHQFTHVINMNRGVACGPDIESITEEMFNKESVRCTVNLRKLPRSGNKVLEDLSRSGLLGYNFGMELNLIAMRINKDCVKFVISPRKIVSNHAVLCRLQPIVMRKDTAMQTYLHEKIISIDQGKDIGRTVALIRLHKTPGDISEQELDNCLVCVGVQALFVNPLL